jgi:hypothetical protein
MTPFSVVEDFYNVEVLGHPQKKAEKPLRLETERLSGVWAGTWYNRANGLYSPVIYFIDAAEKTIFEETFGDLVAGSNITEKVRDRLRTGQNVERGETVTISGVTIAGATELKLTYTRKAKCSHIVELTTTNAGGIRGRALEILDQAACKNATDPATYIPKTNEIPQYDINLHRLSN